MEFKDIDSLRYHIKKIISDEYAWKNLSPVFTQYKKAAILFPLTYNSCNKIEVWLTKRSQHVTHDKGHICFPGGMYEDQHDRDEIDTALREAHEEIGLDRSFVDVLGILIPYINNRKVLITPVIAIVADRFQPRPNHEVEVAFKMPLSRFLKNDNYNSFILRNPHSNINSIVHIFSDTIEKNMNVVTFGVTATMLVEVAVAVLKKLPEFDQTNYNIEKPFLRQTMIIRFLTESWKTNEIRSKL
ncbi:hypothetical protein HELRODRAFT_66947 [Helobdella robusta]|uniref:Nudix hydrolase domain-containing protein n=1 Tax=Helobdella robusta TaxID=6412 RepID=T1FYT7_HELRO|nr:hypothetical protein HELRODRAFT_66947 [Helobdella robusta]ESN99307.1 hypothetical protein HELRODRAFT_66947 [Helobdella robusta]